MTTTVKVEAHCDDETKEVEIVVGGDTVVIQDGEPHEFVVFDDVVGSVREREKV